ncbi:MAG: molecular chaperone TorD family protein [Myxococcota bacterium]
MTGQRSAARARVYGLLARVFQHPKGGGFDALRREGFSVLRAALAQLGARPELVEPAEQLVAGLASASAEELAREYEGSFEPSGGQARPPNETAHAPETPQESMTRTFQLADIAGFYRAFGVEVTPGSERVDHIAAELEFMHLLAVKQALAEDRGESENAAICRDASAAFLRDHLGRWCPRFGAQLEDAAHGGVYRAAGAVLGRFVELELASASDNS